MFATKATYGSCCCLAIFVLCGWASIPVLAQEAVVPGSVAEPASESPPIVRLQLASPFSDHMVLQRDRAIPVWGSAKPGALVRVQLGGKTHEATAGDAGKWRLNVGPLPSGGPLEMSISADDEHLHLTDILIGDVWIASGQSNMEWKVANSNAAEHEIAAATWPKIRLLTVPRKPSAQPADSFETKGWQVCSPESIQHFSAVAYFFGRELQQNLDVPIGLINTSYGGTPMEAWTSAPALGAAGTFDEVSQNLLGNKDRPQHHPSKLYNAMISPLIPYGIRGAIWYQGESNAGRHRHYHELSELMIADWRERWGQGDFPFLLVQLAGWRADANDWPYLRESQLQTTQTVPNTAMAVATDIGHPTDIHPRNKQAVGKRLALAARALAYNEDIVYSGPIYKSMESRAGRALVTFDHVGGGLQIGKGGLTAHGSDAQNDGLLGFEIAGADRQFVAADTKIVGDKLEVSSDQVTEPVAVRYNWTGWTEGNLYNAEGLPASPFRSDRY